MNALILFVCYQLPFPALQPAPATAQLPTSTVVQYQEGDIVEVDLIIVNQYCQTMESIDDTGREVMKSQVTFYTSFWRIHWVGFGWCQTPIMQHMGWEKSKPLVQCTMSNGQPGWASVDKVTIAARKQVFMCTDFDFEYRNRVWFTPIRN